MSVAKRLVAGLFLAAVIAVSAAPAAWADLRVENPTQSMKGARASFTPSYFTDYQPVLPPTPDPGQPRYGEVRMCNQWGSNRNFRWALVHRNASYGDQLLQLRLEVTYSTGDPTIAAYDFSPQPSHTSAVEVKIAQTSNDTQRWNVYFQSQPIEYNLYWYTHQGTTAGTLLRSPAPSYTHEEGGYASDINVFNVDREWRPQTDALYGDCYPMDGNSDGWDIVIDSQWNYWRGAFFY